LNSASLVARRRTAGETQGARLLAADAAGVDSGARLFIDDLLL
jgi:hypothetical protein